MELNFYRRHSARCGGNHNAYSCSYEHDEKRRGWKRCACPIYASGEALRVEGDISKKPRRNTEETDWRAAAAKSAASLQRLSSDAVQAAAEAVKPIKAIEHERARLGATLDTWIASKKNDGISAATERKYRTFAKQLRAFADAKGYVMVDQFGPLDIDEFYQTWKDAPRARGRKLEKLRSFFRYCVSRKLLPESPVEIRTPKGANDPANKTPYTDAEVDHILSACDRIPATKWNNGRTGEWDGDEVRTFILLACYTGLRISDLATFDIGRLDADGNCFLRMHKTKKPLATWLPPDVAERVRALARKRGPKPFMTPGGSTRIDTVADLWRRKLDKVWALCGTWAENPTAHRFRHTFVRILLQNGASPKDVAELIGDIEEMVLKHYARWVPERQERLTAILREKLAPKIADRGKVVNIRR